LGSLRTSPKLIPEEGSPPGFGIASLALPSYTSITDMLDLAKHIVTQKAADFEPERFEDRYEEALTELINAKRQGKTIGTKPRPRGENVVDLMDALKKSLATEAPAKGKKPRKAAAGQKEMLLPIEGKKTAKKAAKSERSTGSRKAG
jgi:DNA end-binding protein Ku